jgi:hypothetical protein
MLSVGDANINILVIHKLPLFRNNRIASVEHASYILKNQKLSKDVYFWNYRIPISKGIEKFPWDLIFLNSTLLSEAQVLPNFTNLKKNLRFLETSSAFKVALPQDEYYCPENLQEVFINWGVDYIVTLFPEHISNLYPILFSKKEVIFKQGYTFYNSSLYSDIYKKYFNNGLLKRNYDLVYRSYKPEFANTFAWHKSELGVRAESRLKKLPNSIKFDLGSNIITGEKWWNFVSQSKAILGSNSGSNLILRNIEIADKTKKFLRLNHRQPNKIELENMGVKETDYGNFSSISPRIMEAASLGTIQILVKGEYSNFIKPNIDYIPTDNFLSNFTECIEKLNDLNLLERVRNSAWASLSNISQLNFENIFLDVIKRVKQSKNLDSTKKILDINLNFAYLKFLDILKMELYARRRLKNSLIHRKPNLTFKKSGH